MIPLIKPVIPSMSEVDGFLSASRESGIWSNFGPVHEHCIAEIKKLTGNHPVLCSSATTAIYILLRLLPEPDASVLVPDYTHAGSLLPVINNGMYSVLVQCDGKTRAMDLSVLEAALGDEGDTVSAAIIVNPFGRGIDRKSYSDLAMKHGVDLIYDYAGAWGDFEDIDDGFPTVYSFHATKSCPIGEGACVVMPSGAMAERFRRLSNFCTEPDRMIRQLAGINGKLSEISCAVLAAQLADQSPAIWRRLARRRHLQQSYSDAIEERPSHRGDILHMNLSLCTVELPGTFSVADFEASCGNAGFVARQYYIPLSTMPAFRSIPYEGRRCPGLDRCVALPSDVTMETCGEIIESVARITEELAD